jgi:hypothetical protein
MTKDDLNSLAWAAMRYALGRKTYVVEAVCSALKNNAGDIRSDIILRMSKEIDKAICNGEAGMPIDIEAWEMVLESFEEASK